MNTSHTHASLVYISGKMSGLPKQEYNALFEQAEQSLAQQGYNPINPCRMVDDTITDNMPYSELLMQDFRFISLCSAIYLLSNWQDSPGARAEKAFAEATGKTIMYQQK